MIKWNTLPSDEQEIDNYICIIEALRNIAEELHYLNEQLEFITNCTRNHHIMITKD